VPATLVAGWLVVFSGSVFKIVYAGFLSLAPGFSPVTCGVKPFQPLQRLLVWR
jgi:hypothetical protein